ncbi:MAG TPA: alpha/beta fold hydrolase [Anaerolineaceae bacterium]|nr:alpha/beta fold hydrolase [Anaerolineaceae bacterium]HPN52336.1 alpha/beta fold hydrolase [Anaerolineaceae bacterium]
MIIHKNQLKLPDRKGRVLSYTEMGKPDGFPIIIHHGLIASISGIFIFEKLAAAGVRLICPARPGYGESSPFCLKNVAEWGHVAAELVKALELDRFDVLGISSGAPYSYAAAWRLPKQIRHVYILSGTPALYAAQVQACWPYPLSQKATLPEMQALARDLFFTGLTSEAYETDDIRDSMMNEAFGVGQDLLIRCQDWGFSLSGVTAPVFMRHSRADEAVPFMTAEITAGLLPACRLEIRENEPHFSRAVLDDFIQTGIIPKLK